MLRLVVGYGDRGLLDKGSILFADMWKHHKARLGMSKDGRTAQPRCLVCPRWVNGWNNKYRYLHHCLAHSGHMEIIIIKASMSKQPGEACSHRFAGRKHMELVELLTAEWCSGRSMLMCGSGFCISMLYLASLVCDCKRLTGPGTSVHVCSY